MIKWKKIAQATLVMSLLWQLVPPLHADTKVYAEEASGEQPVPFTKITDASGRMIAQRTKTLIGDTKQETAVPKAAEPSAQTEAAANAEAEPAYETFEDSDGGRYSVLVEDRMGKEVKGPGAMQRPNGIRSAAEATEVGDTLPEEEAPRLPQEEERDFTVSFEDGLPVAYKKETAAPQGSGSALNTKNNLSASISTETAESKDSGKAELLIEGVDGYVNSTYIYAWNGDYYEYIPAAGYVWEKTEQGLLAHLSGLDWDKFAQFYVSGRLNGTNYFAMPITKANQENAAKLDGTQFTEVSAALEEAGDGYEQNYLGLTAVDEKGRPVTVFELQPGSKVYAGTYNVQFNAEESDSAYSLFKKDVLVSGAETTIEFPKKGTVKIPVTPSGSGLKLLSFIAIYWDGFNSINVANAREKSYLVLNPLQYSFVDLQYTSDTGYYYGFSQSNVSPATKSLEVDFNLQMTLNPSKHVYLPNDYATFNIYLYDGSGKMRLWDIWGPAFDNEPFTVKVMKGEETISETASWSNGHFVLPEQTGTYELVAQTEEDAPLFASASETIKVQEPVLSLLLPDQDMLQTGVMELRSRVYYDTDSTSYYYEGKEVSFIQRLTDAGTRLDVNADLSDCSSCYLILHTDKYSFTLPISAKDKGKLINVDPGKLVSLSWEVPYADGSFIAEDKALSYLDENNKSVFDFNREYAGNYAVTPGRYNLQLNGIDEGHGYMLFMPNVTVQGNKQSIVFPKSDASLIRLHMEDERLHTSYFGARPNTEQFQTIWWPNLQGREDVFLTTGKYNLDINFIDDNKWQYEFPADYSSSAGDVQLTFNTNFRFEDRLQERYRAGQELGYYEVPILDSYGNQLVYVRKTDSDETPTVAAEFTGESGEVATQTSPLTYPYFEIPDQLGYNSLTLSVSGGPVEVAPLTKKIYIADPNAYDLTFFIPDEEITSAEALYAYNQTYESGWGIVDSMIMPAEGGTRIGIKEINWRDNAEQFIVINTNKQSFYLPITQDQQGQTIPVDISGLVPVTVTAAGAGQDFKVDTLALTYTNAEGRPFFAMNVKPGAKVPAGVYGVQVNAQDSSKAYMLFRDKVEIGSKETNTNLTFQKSELALLTPKQASKELKPAWFGAFDWNHYSTVYYMKSSQLKPICVTKNTYQLEFGFNTNDGWGMSYSISNVNATKDQTISMDTKFQAKLSLRNRYYTPGSELQYPDFNGVYDSYNNRIGELHGPDYSENVTFQFINRATKEVVTQDAYIWDRPYFPEQEGTYDLTYSVQAPFKVAPASAVVKVGEGPAVTQLTLSPSSLTIEGIGMLANVKATATYADGTKEDVTNDASWSEENSNVVFAYGGGEIVSLGIGTTTIKATYKGVLVKIPVTVVEKPVTSLTLSPTKIAARPGDEKAVTLTATYKDKTQENVTAAAEWTSSNAEVAEIVEDKLVVHDYGTATLTAKFRGKQASLTIDSSVKSLVIGTAKQSELKSVSLKPGDDLQLSAKAVFSDSAKAETLSDVQWSVSDSNILSVENGLVHVKAFGSATVTAAFGGKSAVLTVNATIKSLSASIGKSSLPKTVTMKLQETKQITLSAVLGDNSKSDATQAASWSTSDASIATVEAGLVTAKQFGKATVTAAYGGKTISFVIDTTIKSLTADKKTISSHPGGTAAVKLSAVMADNSKADASSLAEWSSADPQTASVVNGVVTIHKLGKTTITGSYGGKSVTVTVDATVTSLTVSTTKLSGKPGDSKSVTLSAVYGDRTKAVVTAEAEWVSSNASVASVDDGTITFHTMDKATITATYGGKKVTLTADASVSKLTPSATSIRLKAGGTQQVTAKATYSDGKTTADVTGDVQFTVANTTVASVQLESGKLVVTALKKGSTKLTLKYGGKTVEINVTVS